MTDKRIAKAIRTLGKVSRLLAETAADLEAVGLGYTAEKVAQLSVDAKEARQFVVVSEEAWAR